MKSRSAFFRAFASAATAFALFAAPAAAAPASPDSLEEGELIEVLAPERPARVDSADPRAVVPPRPPMLSLTISAFHLMMLFPEVTIEVRPLPRFGVAATGGAMRYLNGMNVQELGGQLRYYPAGGRGGFHLGIEGFWARVYSGELSDEEGLLSALLDHRTVNPYGGGPFAGFKNVRPGGVTFDFQAGLQAITLHQDDEWSLYPILNFNFGKSW